MKKVEVFTPVNHARKHENEKFRWIALFLWLDQDKRAYVMGTIRLALHLS